MEDFRDKVAVVTGGASGIGLGIARALASGGASVVVTDIDKHALDRVCAEFSSRGLEVLPLALDVGDREQMYEAAEEIVGRFGRLDIAVNNAGVAYNAKPLYEAPDDMIDWSLNVNLYGVLNGIKAFVPKIIAGGRGGHVVNTSSIGGFQVRKSDLWHQGLYAATKYAVTALSEGLRHDLEDQDIGVSILAPAAVLTNITSSDRNRQEKFGGPTEGAQAKEVEHMLRDWSISPDAVGERVLQAIRDNELYVFTHVEGLAVLTERHRRIEAAFDAAERFEQRLHAQTPSSVA